MCESPSRQIASGLSHGTDPSVHVVISSNCENRSFQTSEPNRYRLYNIQALSVHWYQFLLFVIQSARAEAKSAVSSIFLLLNE